MTSFDQNTKKGVVSKSLSEGEQTLSQLDMPGFNQNLITLFMKKNAPDLLTDEGDFAGYPKRVYFRTAKETKAKNETEEGFIRLKETKSEQINAVFNAANQEQIAPRSVFYDYFVAHAFSLATQILLKEQQTPENFDALLLETLKKESDQWIEDIEKNSHSEHYIEALINLHLGETLNIADYLIYTNTSPKKCLKDLAKTIIQAAQIIQEALQNKKSPFLKPQIFSDKVWGKTELRNLVQNALERLQI